MSDDWKPDHDTVNRPATRADLVRGLNHQMRIAMSVARSLRHLRQGNTEAAEAEAEELLKRVEAASDFSDELLGKPK